MRQTYYCTGPTQKSERESGHGEGRRTNKYTGPGKTETVPVVDFAHLVLISAGMNEMFVTATVQGSANLCDLLRLQKQRCMPEMTKMRHPFFSVSQR